MNNSACKKMNSWKVQIFLLVQKNAIAGFPSDQKFVFTNLDNYMSFQQNKHI